PNVKTAEQRDQSARIIGRRDTGSALRALFVRGRRHGRPAVWPERDDELEPARVALRDGDRLAALLGLAAHAWMPDAGLVAAGSDVREPYRAIVGRLAEVRRRRDVDVAHHPVVDVAAEDDDAGFVEEHGRGGGAH